MRFTYSYALTVVAILNSVGTLSAADITKESLSEIKRNIDNEKAVLVDVREKREWDQGHVQGAIFFPLSQVRDGVTKAELKVLPKDKTLYTHCVVGKRAVTVGNVLERYGYKVKAVKPGYKELIAAGFSKATE
ncbi:rhodanese-like domain-containing protein [Thalassoglobus polymorphus]|uniref:Thiosulfate sulfurtransferase PspE n=1 Tax=Thalassoglobus polymorphus TaxID=2527994 RepID=A0A517QKQ7_9PLAN|nr:rhodanese-like domain-containing protein [Thalassoglobus polymorphus]QDT32226.1 Thiosulfate sulfurtransferase PspE precursor [Thalassoglobus polymorphus]